MGQPRRKSDYPAAALSEYNRCTAVLLTEIVHRSRVSDIIFTPSCIPIYSTTIEFKRKKRDDQVLRRRVPFVLFHFLTTPKRGPQTAIALLSHNEHNVHVYNIFIFYCIQYIYISILYTYYIYLYTSHRICSSRLAIAETRRNCAASAAVAL